MKFKSYIRNLSSERRHVLKAPSSQIDRPESGQDNVQKTLRLKAQIFKFWLAISMSCHLHECIVRRSAVGNRW